MFLSRLTVVNFKNYVNQTFAFDKKVTCLTGRNGIGKTNLLDAIYYLCLTKSFFSGIESYNFRHGESFFTIKGELSAGDEILTFRVKNVDGRNKEFYKNDVKYQTLSEHIGTLPVVFISPNDISLVYGSGEERRKFLDGLISQIDLTYLEGLHLYNKLLSQRNTLLKQLAESGSKDLSLLKVYDEKMIEPGSYIHQERKNMLAKLEPVFQSVYHVISGGREAVSLQYDSQLNEVPLGELFSKNFEKDRIVKHTTAGIHRDDIHFMMDAQIVKKFGSQGQQKSYLVSIKLSQYELIKQASGKKPFLLLDDIFDKLDEERSANLLNYITTDQFGQIFITDTQEERIRKIFSGKEEMVAINRMDSPENH